MRIFIIGVNGFIGNALVTECVRRHPEWSITGIDIENDRLSEEVLAAPKFDFHHGDMTISREWVEFQIKRADVIVPLAAVAIPRLYVENPLFVFELDFKENLRIVELAAKYNKRLVFPSTSEVYAMCEDAEFDEESSNFVLGPINKQRWIYSSSKQLLDRVIHAYGLKQGFDYTLFRPFNWVGPHLDRIEEHKIGNSRVLTQFIADVAFNRPISLVDGGQQKRSFCYIADGIDALVRILENKDKVAYQKIYNIGNPKNELSIGELAKLVVRHYNEHPRARSKPFTAGLHEVRSQEYYGEGYQDVSSRMPSIKRAMDNLGWKPVTDANEAVRLTLDSFLREIDERAAAR